MAEDLFGLMQSLAPDLAEELSRRALVLERISDIMAEHNINDPTRVGIYGITYKENVDDIRESPTLQMYESMKRHLATGVRFYDPYVKNDVLPGQMHDFGRFLDEVDMVVIMVAHDEIKTEQARLSGKVIFDTRKVCTLPGGYRL